MYQRISSLVLLLAMTAAACGSGASDAGVATLDDPIGSTAGIASLDGSDGTVAAMNSEEAMLALTECLREQGLDVPDPELGDDGEIRLGALMRSAGESTFDRETMRAAMDACSEYLELVTTQFRDSDRTEIEDQIYAYAACMRENGYEMADPDFGDSGGLPGHVEGEPGDRQGPFGDLDLTDPAFQAANQVCQDLFGGFGPGGGGGFGPPGGGAPGDGA